MRVVNVAAFVTSLALCRRRGTDLSLCDYCPWYVIAFVQRVYHVSAFIAALDPQWSRHMLFVCAPLRCRRRVLSTARTLGKALSSTCGRSAPECWSDSVASVLDASVLCLSWHLSCSQMQLANSKLEEGVNWRVAAHDSDRVTIAAASVVFLRGPGALEADAASMFDSGMCVWMPPLMPKVLLRVDR